jgi:hypothetical protein
MADVLPLVTATADSVWRAERPLSLEDNHWNILTDLGRPLAFYRLLGPSDEDQGNVLKLTKNVPASTVVVTE